MKSRPGSRWPSNTWSTEGQFTHTHTHTDTHTHTHKHTKCILVEIGIVMEQTDNQRVEFSINIILMTKDY